jgi:hypothetical protein
MYPLRQARAQHEARTSFVRCRIHTFFVGMTRSTLYAPLHAHHLEACVGGTYHPAAGHGWVKLCEYRQALMTCLCFPSCQVVEAAKATDRMQAHEFIQLNFMNGTRIEGSFPLSGPASFHPSLCGNPFKLPVSPC